jgi:DNA end-binding protein Ku
VAPRAIWKGFLKVGELVCPVALHAAASTSERIAFHTLSRATGHRVRRQLVDEETGREVAAADQVKGYETGPDEYVVLEPEEVAAAVPDSDKTLAVETFIRCGDIDSVYLDRPYYLTPADPAAQESFALIREGMRAREVAALSRAVLFRRLRTVLIRAEGPGLIGATLRFDYEVQSAKEAFADLRDIEIEGEMLDLARHIIETKSGTFDPSSFEDRYEEALAALVRAKQKGEPIEVRRAEAPSKVVDLMKALRESAAAAGGGARKPPRKAASASKGSAKRAAGSSAKRSKTKTAPAGKSRKAG